VIRRQSRKSKNQRRMYQRRRPSHLIPSKLRRK
jgi:hypothetical protein